MENQMQNQAKTQMKTFGVGNRVNHDSAGFYKRNMYADTPTKTNGALKEIQLKKETINIIHNKSSENMHELPDNSVHLMVTSPPYNVGKDYDDDLTAEQYRELLCNVWKETYRVLVDGGRACINVANIGRKPYIPLREL